MQTDTVAGLIANPFDDDALRHMASVKQRDTEKKFQLLCRSWEVAARYAHICNRAEEVLASYSPGRITMVLRATQSGVREIASLAISREEDGEYIGVRIPDHDGLQQLISAFGGVVAATSMNLSGGQIVATHKEAQAFVQSVKDGGRRIKIYGNFPDAPLGSSPSHVVKISCNGCVDILR